VIMWGAGSTLTGNIMVIDTKMSWMEQKAETLMNTESGEFLLQALSEARIPINDAYFTKAIKKPGIGWTKEVKEDMRQKLYDEIDKLKPRYIIGFGKETLDLLFRTTAITKHHGFRHFNNIPTTITFSALNAIRNLACQELFRTDLDYARAHICKEIDKPCLTFKPVLIHFKEQLLILKKFMLQDNFSYDLETKKDGTITMMGVYLEQGTCVIIPFDTRFHTNYTLDDVHSCLREIFASKTTEKIAHYSTFDNDKLKKLNIDAYTSFDTYLAAYVLGEAKLGLKALARKYFYAPPYDEGIEFKDELTEEEYKDMAIYCGYDAYYTYKLYKRFDAMLDADKSLNAVFKYIMIPGNRVLQEIKNTGIYADKKTLDSVTTQITQEKELFESKLKNALPVGYKELNPNSIKQLRELLFKKLKLTPVKATAKGVASTDRESLIYLAEEHEIPKLLLEYRKREKSINGFLMPWQEYIKEDGRLHTTYNIAKTATGRLSAQDPNLQQVPRLKAIRGIITAKPGYTLIEADYSQIELRAAAHIANETRMKEVYRNGEDIHMLTAASIARCKLEDVTYELRTKAKAVNFGFLYGMWWVNFKSYAFLSYGVKLTDADAQLARDTYFKTYPKLLPWHERQIREARKYGFVRTPTGRIRYLPNINSPDYMLKGEAERQAINTPVQGFASDITVLAMILIDRNLKKHYGDKAYLVGQVHDAILVEAENSIAYEVGVLVKSVMEKLPVVLEKYFDVVLDIPLIAEVELGAWGSGVDLKKFKKIS